MAFLANLVHRFKRRRKKTQSTKVNHVADASSSTGPAQPNTPRRSSSSSVVNDDRNLRIVPASLRPVSDIQPTPAGSVISNEDQGSETAYLHPSSPIPPTPSSIAARHEKRCSETDELTSHHRVFRTGHDGLAEVSLRPGNQSPPSGFFPNAQNMVFHKAKMIDNSTNSTTVITIQSAAMDKLSSHTEPNAAVDSSAREPVPTCHPKTRLQIREKLAILLHDGAKQWRIIWLFGAAGTGKSAVCQTFASECDERGELGAAFFFSRPNGRNKYQTVIPTLAYQLATRCPSYRLALITKIDHDQQIFNKKPPVQLKKLIIEPLLEVRSQMATTYLMLLDGIDECGENMEYPHERQKEQRELVKMIAEAVHDYPDLPLFWLLCSRPEKHLQNAFTDISTVCRREELLIDAQCRAEVEVVLREGFARIVAEHDVIVPGPGGWPSEDEFNTVECAVAGLHVFGAAILKDIEYSGSPVRQLESLIPFLEHVAGTSTPGSIQVMDLFYARILGDVPASDLGTTLRIIGFLITMPSSEYLSAQALCNFMQLKPNDFSSALRMVHSVINIPSPEEADKDALHIYHASFSDFLTDATRSGIFFVEKQKTLVDLIKKLFFWHEFHCRHFHSSCACPLTYRSNMDHDHDPLPQVTWISSKDNHRAISSQICRYAEDHCFELFGKLDDQRNEELLSCVHHSDLRYMTSSSSNSHKLMFFNWVYNQDPSSGFIRTEPKNDEDRTLLTYLETLTKEPMTPAEFPLSITNPSTKSFCKYIFVGRDSSSIIVCYRRFRSYFFMGLNLDQTPDESMIVLYEEKLGIRFPDPKKVDK